MISAIPSGSTLIWSLDSINNDKSVKYMWVVAIHPPNTTNFNTH